MKNKKFKNLFVRGGKSALVALSMASLIACRHKDADPHAKIENDDGFFYLVALLFVVFIVPLSVDFFGNYDRNKYINNNNNNKRRR